MMQLICGLFHLDGRAAQNDLLDRMLTALQHRSPHAHRSTYLRGSVALGKVSVREPETSPQLPRARSGLVLAADVRLDERGLDASSDVHDLLERLQAAHLGAVIGDFALAAWDPQHSRLTCARDGMGIRPLFYVYQQGSIFAFASRPAGLLAAGIASSQLDTTYIADTLLRQATGPEISLFKDIQRVPPGASLLVTPERLEVRTDWQLPLQPVMNERIGPQEAAEEARRLLAQAVRCRVPAQGALATHLSGGLDSSAVTLLAAETVRGGARVHAYSMLPNQADHEDTTTEWPFVQAVICRSPDLEWHPVHCGEGMDFIRPRMDRDQLMPLDDAWPEARILAHAAQQQASCLLSGWGGDEGISFNGRGVLVEALLRRRWSYVICEAQRLAARSNSSRWRVIAGEILPNLPGRRWFDRFRREPRYLLDLRTYISPELLASLQRRESVTREEGDTFHHALMRGTHLWQRTEHWNLTAAHHGLSVLFPMLDRRLMEFAYSLPGHLFLREGTRRWLFRKAVGDLLPTLLLERSSKFRSIHDAPRILHASAAQARNWISTLRNDTRITSVLNVREAERRLARLAAQDAQDVSVLTSASLLLVLRTAAFLEQHA